MPIHVLYKAWERVWNHPKGAGRRVRASTHQDDIWRNHFVREEGAAHRWQMVHIAPAKRRMMDRMAKLAKGDG